MKETPPSGLDVRLAKALSHPLRRRLLIAYSERPSSPSELAASLDEPLNEVSYHTKQLLTHGCIELVREERRRGRAARIYRATVPFEFENAEWGSLSPHVRGSVLGPILETLWLELAGAGESGALLADDTHVSRVRLDLDARGWNEITELLRGVVDEVQRIGREADGRSATARRECVVGLLGFEP